MFQGLQENPAAPSGSFQDRDQAMSVLQSPPFAIRAEGSVGRSGGVHAEFSQYGSALFPSVLNLL